MKDFGNRLKAAREEKGLSQRSLGLALGLSDKTISSYESLRSYPNLEVLKRISEVLNKPIEYFISSSNRVFIQDILERILNKQELLSKEIENLKELLKREE